MMMRLAAWLVLGFLALPVLTIVVTSFNATSSFAFPPEQWSLRWYRNVFDTPVFGSGLVMSLWLAVASSLIGLVAGTMTALAVVRYRFPGRGLILSLVMAPLVVPEVVIGLSLLIWLQSVRWLSGNAAILLLHCLVVLPFVVRILVANLQRTDVNLEHAAMLLGASPAQAFLRVTLPTIAKGLAGALVFALVMSFHNFTATFFLVSTQQTLPVAIFQYIRTEHDPTIAALSTMLMVGAMAVVWVTDRLLGLERVTK